MTKSFEIILSKFPDHRIKIIDLYNSNEEFRVICDDYVTSTKMLQECRQNVIKDKEFENEFLEVNLELEKEIIHLLNNLNY